jgi:DnaJ-domain-containing protein 1
MPKIVLKPNSPEYHEPRRKAAGVRHCEMPNCSFRAEFRAPKDRGLSDYYWFCEAHVRDYNAAWDFFAGMAEQDVELHIIQSLYGDRPTWRSDAYRGFAEELQAKIRAAYTGQDEPKPEEPQERRITGNPELDALAVIGLDAPATFAAIKARYRELVKKYHPDTNGHDVRSEEIIKQVNMAYTILKMCYRPDDEQISAAAE